MAHLNCYQAHILGMTRLYMMLVVHLIFVKKFGVNVIFHHMCNSSYDRITSA